jgi:hypothetical protein
VTRKDRPHRSELAVPGTNARRQGTGARERDRGAVCNPADDTVLRVLKEI